MSVIATRPTQRRSTVEETRERLSCELTASSYHLERTLTSGQTFRWRLTGSGWEGVALGRWVRLVQDHPDRIRAEVCQPSEDWRWLHDYLRLEDDLEAIVATFPDQPILRQAAKACAGLHLLRQDPWECLASFVLSSTKQICQIEAVVEQLCARYGEPILGPTGQRVHHAFPAAARLAEATERELRECRMGFRAPYLKSVATAVASGQLRLEQLASLPLEEARANLMQLPGVGRKIADCVLLFSCGQLAAFPVDVWIRRGLETHFLGGVPQPLAKLLAFATEHFGPNAGYAQQYLFHYLRNPGKQARNSARPESSSQP